MPSHSRNRRKLTEKRTILVTGSAGHLGEAMVRTLRTQHRPVLGVDLNPSPFTDRVGSITDRDFVKECMAGAHAVVHAATLHKPHVATHSRQAFVDTNVTGTLVLLEEATSAGVQTFVYTSTTSVFSGTLRDEAGAPAAWITDSVVPIAKNIYGVTKLAAEHLCELFALRQQLAVVILRTARFFPEADDDAAIRGKYEIGNAQANELLYRRADIEDVVEAHLLAIQRAPAIGFGRYIISATTPFTRQDLAALGQDAPSAVHRLFPESRDLYSALGWTFFPRVDRVYVNDRAMAALGWLPKYDFRHVLDSLRLGQDFRSPLARAVGSKGYHPTVFEDGPYPVAP
jgi:UDP-glucose 4-epimerase